MGDYIKLSVVLLLHWMSLSVYSQCATAPAESGYNCSGGNGMAANGQTINNGETYWFTGTGTFTNQVVVEKGGTFIICGDLTLSGGINIKGDAGGEGVVVVKTGGSMSVTTGGSTSLDGHLYNYGDVSVSNTFTINASGATYINASTSATLSVGGAFTVNGSTNFVNYGTADFADVTTNASAGACMGNGAEITVSGQFRNEGANTWSSPSGNSCIFYDNAGNSALNQALTSDSDLLICASPTAGTISNIGSATLTTNCTGCATLPITLLYFSVDKGTNNNLRFKWATSTEINNDYFNVEYSFDGLNFYGINQLKGNGTSYEVNYYEYAHDFTDLVPTYYRLKQTDFDGKYSYSPIEYLGAELEYKIFPNPTKVNQELNLMINARGIIDVEIQSITTTQTMYSERFNLGERYDFQGIGFNPELQSGTYLVKIILHNKVLIEKIVVRD